MSETERLAAMVAERHQRAQIQGQRIAQLREALERSRARELELSIQNLELWIALNSKG